MDSMRAANPDGYGLPFMENLRKAIQVQYDDWSHTINIMSMTATLLKPNMSITDYDNVSAKIVSLRAAQKRIYNSICAAENIYNNFRTNPAYCYANMDFNPEAVPPSIVSSVTSDMMFYVDTIKGEISAAKIVLEDVTGTFRDATQAVGIPLPPPPAPLPF